MNLLWNANLTTEHIPWNEPNRRFRTHTRFESFPEIIFVPKSAAVVKRLELVSGQSLDLVEGDYSLFLTIRTESRSVRVVTLKRTIRIRRQDESFLLASTVPSDQRAENLRLHFDYEVDVYVSLRPYAATSTPSAAPAN